ncbi:aldo/keto reductase [Dellaglioa sp. BT-FLS60]
MEYVTLNDGNKMPVMGFGVYQITDLKVAEQSVVDAIQAGYQLIDTAQAYGNEEGVGAGIKRSGAKREDLFITTKLWISNFGYEKAKASLDESLRKLKLDYVDLVLLHQPYADTYGAWRALEEAQKEGKVKSIGVSNFYNDQLTDLAVFNNVKPAVNQIELNPFFQEKESVDYMRSYNVQAEAWAPFAEGRNGLFTNPILQEIANKYQKNVGQVVLRWLTQQKIVALAKSVHKERIVDNLAIFDFKLTDAEMKMINDMDTNTSQFFDHRDPETIKSLSGHIA